MLDMKQTTAREPATTWTLGALALFFSFLYVSFLAYFPRLPGEFSYSPALAPMPFAVMRGFTVEQLLLHLGRLGLLGPALVFASLALAPFVRPLALDDGRLRRTVFFVCLLSLLGSAAVLTRVLKGEAIVDDELTYRDQAMLLADGRLAETAVPPIGLEPFTIESRAGLTGKYLFGEPLVQVLGSLLGLPGLLHLPLAALTLFAWFRIARAAAGDAAGAWATAALALSPMFVFTNGTGLSNSTALCAMVLAGLGLLWCREGRPLAGAVLAGGALGFACTVRPQVAVPIGGVLGVVLLRHLVRARRFGALAACVASGGVFLLAIGVYDRAITGSPWRLPWSLFPSHETLGFVAPHSVGAALSNLLVSLVRWNGWWLGLPLSLGVVAVWWALGRPRCGLRLWGTAGLALVALDFLYYSPGVADTGPVYYAELLLPGSLLVGAAIAGALVRWPRLATSVLLVHALLGTGSFFVEQASRLSRLRGAIHDSADVVLASLETPALLFYETYTAEHRTVGWVQSFPVRTRSERDPIVIYPRHSAEEVRALRALWSGRRCYYTHVDPESGQTTVARCEAVEDVLARPADPVKEGMGLMPAPTSARLGYLSPRPSAPVPWSRGAAPER
jgi:hypothetical protein